MKRIPQLGGYGYSPIPAPVTLVKIDKSFWAKVLLLGLVLVIFYCVYRLVIKSNKTNEEDITEVVSYQKGDSSPQTHPQYSPFR